MRELSLFTGAGGGVLGTKLLGFDHAGYVEINEYCQRIIAQRIKDGVLDNAPIFSDIRTFISEGYADAYSGMVDIVTAGFPCQPFSVAGKNKGEHDERNMWPETIEVIRRVRPKFALLENVPGLFNHKYIQRIFADLAEGGFDAKWRVLSAAEIGAPHKRDRIWIIANANELPDGQQYEHETKRNDSERKNSDVADASGANVERLRKPIGIQEESNSPCGTSWWTTEPDVGRVAHGVAARMDRLKAVGNGQVPAVVRAAWWLLNDDQP